MCVLEGGNMLGAIIGDYVGSRFEWNNIKIKEFELFHNNCQLTDDSIMTIAVADALLNVQFDYKKLSSEAVRAMQFWGRKYPNRGYGTHFEMWIGSSNPEPYNSYGNGSAMRVSPCGWIGNDIETVKKLSRLVTEVSHNHPEGIKGAEATAVSIFLARTGYSLDEIRDYVMDNYYNVDFRLDDIRKTYFFDVSCQGSVPQALAAFFESYNFEDAIRNAISIGGDSDTIAAITGAVAEAYYGIPPFIKKRIKLFLDEEQLSVVNRFYNQLDI